MRKVLASTTGWLLTLSWVAYLAACATIIGNWMTYCILVYRPDLPAANSQWFPSTIGIAILFGGAAFNIYLAKQLLAIEGVMLSIHLAGWVAVMITLWVMSPRGRVANVIFTFSNPAGWPNAGVASLIGVITPWGSVIGYDSSVHMSMFPASRCGGPADVYSSRERERCLAHDSAVSAVSIRAERSAGFHCVCDDDILLRRHRFCSRILLALHAGVPQFDREQDWKRAPRHSHNPVFHVGSGQRRSHGKSPALELRSRWWASGGTSFRAGRTCMWNSLEEDSVLTLA